MGIADPEAALEKLREFRHLHALADGDWDEGVPAGLYRDINRQSLLVNDIAHALGLDGADVSGYEHEDIIDFTDQLIGKLELQDDHRLIFGPIGPTLAASGFHPWVWCER